MTLDALERSLRAFQESRILLTAIELDVFTAVGDGATHGEVAERAGLEPRAAERLLNALVPLELLRKQGGRYENEPLARRFLVEGTPECARAAWLHLVHRWETWSRLTARMRGATPHEEHRGLAPARHDALLAMLDRRSRRRAPDVVSAVGAEGVERILDIGGGAGTYSIAFARANPRLQAEVLDLPEVIPITRRYLDEAGLGERVRARPGDFLAHELGSGYDLVLLCSVVHLLGPDEINTLFARCFRALRPGGRIAIVDHILNADKTAPRDGAIFALNMLLATANGGTYSFEEYEEWLSAAGFSRVERPRTFGSIGLLVATR